MTCFPCTLTTTRMLNHQYEVWTIAEVGQIFGLIYEATKQLGSARTLRILWGLFTSHSHSTYEMSNLLRFTTRFHFTLTFFSVFSEDGVSCFRPLSILFYFIFIFSPFCILSIPSKFREMNECNNKLLNLERYIERIGKIYINFRQEIFLNN